jgi:hypothetical protein
MGAQVMIPCVYETPGYSPEEKTNLVGCTQNCCISPGAKFKKVSDFPKTWDNLKYTNPFMCVSCLFKSDTNLWSIALYNHTASKWDPYVTNDLVSWRPANTESNFDASYGNQQAYQVFDTCVVGSQNLYSSNVPLDGILDLDVVANNYERTGIVISDGDSVIINNDSQNAISAQVWGYEG